MQGSDTPTHEDVLAIVAGLVPDIPRPSEIIAKIEAGDKTLWLEGWCDGCIADRGFPPKGQGMLEEKVDYIRALTPEFLKQRAEDRNMIVLWSGFIPLEGKRHLYGVSWGIFARKP